MDRPLRAGLLALAALALLLLTSPPSRADFTDFTTWSLVQDPADPHLTAGVSPSAASLVVTGGPIPAGTDIGFASINGNTAATSSFGYVFDPSASFSLAIDFRLSFSNIPTGTLALGFGIGEERTGEDSAGAVLLTSNGFPLAFGAAARIHDKDQPAQPILAAPSLSGSLFVTYNAASGDVTVGASSTPGAAAPSATATFAGIQHQWSGSPLLASFFLRSDGSPGNPWQSGDAQAVVSNLRVLTGTPRAVPEPGSLLLVTLGVATLATGRRRSQGMR